MEGTMGLKDLLVHVDNDPACRSRLDVAVALAASHGAHLAGIHAMGWPRFPGYVEVELPPTFLQDQRRHLERQAQRAEARFHEAARGGGLTGEWRSAVGDIIGTVSLHARYADLTVVGQGLDLGSAPEELARLAEELALGVGRPVLVVPRYGSFETVGERVLIAWNGSREATRAVHDALPILKRAAKVTTLSIDPEGEPEPRLPGADIALHLARHGIAAEAASTQGGDIAVGDVLLSRAFDLGADLIVMGAYGHSRLRETVLGGATRHLLRNMTVPVLMSH
jgi:nucleotide-binding universal stress UspA family protein